MGAFAKTILDDNTLITATPTLTTSSNNTSDASGLYKSTDTNSGNPTYYFRGNVTNNYVSFAGFTWRIVRINEDYTVRLIMQTGINNNKTYAYGSNSDNYYTQSTLKTTLEEWYETNLGSFESYIVSGTYCEEFRVLWNSSYTSDNANAVYFNNYTPTFKCSTDGNGYGIVNSKIGLLTYDEALFAGGYPTKGNNTYYLYNGSTNRTMSPAGRLTSSSKPATTWSTNNSSSSSYSINYTQNANATAVRPVINVSGHFDVAGSGTVSDPYVIKKVFKDAIIDDNALITSTPTLTTSSNNTSDASGLYKSTDTNSGNPTYYFRGNVTNNYVLFAGFTWRIVRINEDGTIRLIMQDGINNNTAYYYGNCYNLIDCMYFSNSNVKTVLEDWYSRYLNEYDSKIAYGDYCDELHAIISESYNNVSGTIFSKYTPSYKCNDINRNLYLKIGMITYDEYRYAGGYHSSNSQFYLATGKSFWIIGPAGIGNISPVMYHIWRVHYLGGLCNYYVNDVTDNVRPVINLKSDVKISGTGISSDPYVIY